MPGKLLDRLLLAGGVAAIAGAWAVLLQGQTRPPPPVAEALSLHGGTQVQDSAVQVAVVFQLADCSGSIEELAAWSDVHAAGLAKVTGIVLDAPDTGETPEQMLRGAGLEFPLRRESRNDLAGVLPVLGYAQTPVVIVLDRDRRVRVVAPARELTPAAALALAGAPAGRGRR
jgi:hypothetical protein